MNLSLRRRALIVNGALAVLLVGGVGAAYASLNTSVRSETAPATSTVTRGMVSASVSASGAVTSARTRSLSFTGSGTVASVKVEPGDRVKKGQVLAKLDDTDAREALEAAQASLNAAADGDTSTASGYAQYVSALNARKQAQRALAGTVLKAPFAGTVTALNGTAGGPAAGTAGSGTDDTGSTGFVEIADITRLQIVGDFTESDVTKVKSGQAATVTFDAMPGTTATGKVTRIDPVAKTTENVVQYPVTIKMTGVPKSVRLGQTASVQVITGEVTDVLTVPTSAIRTAGGRPTVLVLAKGGAQVPTVVEIGLKGDLTTEIKSGLKDGDQVVRQGTPATTGQQGGFPGGGLGTRIGGGGGGR
ncbi:efflux RND transporter periplasmic adaptor subunit [Streptosporangium soli]|nr:efflux RND transporter periplasmic adaptor subunit [Streptosporangium sp. KLBMP 9127]